MEMEDLELLRDYAENNSEQAFRTLVDRHLNMVYATALRQVGDAHLADEVAQTVFLTLASKSRSISSKTILAGWLFRAARFAAAKAQRARSRREHWERQAAECKLSPLQNRKSLGNKSLPR